MKPRYKLVACVSTETFRLLAGYGLLRSSGWGSSYRRPGKTVPISGAPWTRYSSATYLVFGHGDDIFLCAESLVDESREVGLSSAGS
jgi:hypothetical protein